MRFFGDPYDRGTTAISQLTYSIAVVAVLAAVVLLGSGCALYPDAKKWVKEATVGKQVPTDQELVNKADASMQHNDFSLAEIYLDAALEINPTNPHALTNLGIVYQNTGRKNEARALFTEVIREGSMAIADENADDIEQRKTVILRAAEHLAELDREVIAQTMRGLTDPMPASLPRTPIYDLESQWQDRMETRVAILQELRARDYISQDELVARVGGAWLKAHSEPAPEASDVLERLSMLESMQRRGLLASSAYAVERARILDALAPVKALPENAMMAQAAMLHNQAPVQQPQPMRSEPQAFVPQQHGDAPMPAQKPTGASMGDAASMAETASMADGAHGSAAMDGGHGAHDMVHPVSARTESALPDGVRTRMRQIVPPSDGALIHLASYRSEQGARKAWDNLTRVHNDLLKNLALVVKRVDLGPGQGIYYRVTAGPLHDDTAKELCEAFRARQLFCTVTS